MRLPSKVTSYKESSLSKFAFLLDKINENSLSIYELYEVTKMNFKNIDEFIDVLDCLYALNKIDFDIEREVIVNVI
ncbi:hypothetical protein MKD14_06185 [[Clostridium] innocuum]|nr:hypothetical protein [[Clostridium] innocuum]